MALETDNDIYLGLAGRDWTFAKAQTRGATHAAHPYPAKFIPQIPRTLIESLMPRDGSAVLDPFCGSGTTLVEAAVAGFPAVGVDVHPLACLISKVKVTPLPSSLLDNALRVVERCEQVKARIPEIPKLDHWFAPAVQQALANLVHQINDEGDERIRDALRVALSSIVVRVSRQESDTRYAAVQKDVSPDDVLSGFLKASGLLGEALAATWVRDASLDVRVVNKSVLAVTPQDIGRRVSLVVTSPPYPNAYEYWLYHKYRMYWLGMDPLEVRAQEIGARPHFFKKNPATEDDFRVQMLGVFKLLAQVVVPGGHVCFQVGTSKIQGREVDNAALLRLAATPHGFVNIETFDRQIPMNRKAFNPSHARIREERILLFRLEAK